MIYSVVVWEIKEQFVRSISFSIDSQYLVSGSEDSTVQIWDLYRASSPSPANNTIGGDNTSTTTSISAIVLISECILVGHKKIVYCVAWGWGWGPGLHQYTYSIR